MLLPLMVLVPAMIMAEPILYMFPTNPELHPSSMYPNQQVMRGKVRDLPDSGVIYLDRIKPIGHVSQQGEIAEVEISVQNISSQNKNEVDIIQKLPSSIEKYTSKEEKPTTRSAIVTTTTAAVTYNEKKVDEKKQAIQKSKQSQLSVPEEAELDKLLDDLLKNNSASQTTQKNRPSRTGVRKHVGAHSPKLVSFDGTVRVEKPRARAHASPISISLQPKKLYGTRTSSARYHGPDFDPWERMGQ